MLGQARQLQAASRLRNHLAHGKKVTKCGQALVRTTLLTRCAGSMSDDEEDEEGGSEEEGEEMDEEDGPPAAKRQAKGSGASAKQNAQLYGQEGQFNPRAAKAERKRRKKEAGGGSGGNGDAGAGGRGPLLLGGGGESRVWNASWQRGNCCMVCRDGCQDGV